MTTPPGPGRPNPNEHGAYDQTQIGHPQPGPAYGQSPYGQSQQPYGSGPNTPGYPQAPYGQAQYPQTPYQQTPYQQAPYGQAPYGQTPYPGQPVAGYGPPPQPPQNNKTTRIVVAVVAVMALIAVAGLAVIFFGGDDGKTSSTEAASSSAPFTLPSSTAGDDTTAEEGAVGSCLTVSGSTSVTTRPIGCDVSGTPSFIVAAELKTSSACESAGYPFSVTEYGRSASSRAQCLVPNYQVGTCYTESKFSIGIHLETVSCTTESTATTANFKITERSQSGSVPNCTDSEKQRSDTYAIRTSPAQKLTICREILGDYVWE